MSCDPVHDWLRRNIDEDTADNMIRLARRIPGVDVCTHAPDKTLLGVRFDGGYIGWSHGRTK